MPLYITPVERAALQLLATGKGGREIAGSLGTSELELETHLRGLFARMGVATRTEAVAAALQRGLLSSNE